MKKKLLYIGIILLLFALMYWQNQSKPVNFQWKATYSTHDKQPYGCFVFDEMLFVSWEKYYYHTYNDISTSYSYGELDTCNLLIVSNRFYPTEEEIDCLWGYLEEGGKALVAAEFISDEIQEKVGVNTKRPFPLPINLALEYETSSVFLEGIKDSLQGVPSSMITTYWENKNVYDNLPINYKVLASDDKNNPLIIQFDIGEGELILCTTPLLFTNYAVLNDSLNPYLRTALAHLQEKALLRTEYYEVGESYTGNPPSYLSYLMSQPSLKWACYIVFALIIIFMAFTAKRKQKAIPVVNPPTNKMKEFVHSISNLYLRRNNNADIVKKKYIYWSDEIRRKYGLDVINEKHDRAFIRQFSAKTGMPENEARYLLLELDAIDENTIISDEEMMNLIIKMSINNG